MRFLGFSLILCDLRFSCTREEPGKVDKAELRPDPAGGAYASTAQLQKPWGRGPTLSVPAGHLLGLRGLFESLYLTVKRNK